MIFAIAFVGVMVVLLALCGLYRRRYVRLMLKVPCASVTFEAGDSPLGRPPAMPKS